MKKSIINIGIPSKGRLRKDILKIFKKNKLNLVSERGERDLLGSIKQLKNIKVLYLHAREIVERLGDGSLDLGFSGFDLFKEIEDQGGFLKLLKKGVIQRKLKEQASKEKDLYDDGTEGLLGTHFQQNPVDKMKSNLEIYPFIKQQTRKTLIEPIITRRISEEIEQKRLKNE